MRQDPLDQTSKAVPDSDMNRERQLFDPAHSAAAHLVWLGHRVVDVFLLFWLFVSTGALFPLLASGGTATFDNQIAATLRLLLLPSIVMAPVLMLANRRTMTNLLLNNPLLIALLLWVWASLAWSIDPAISARRALALTTNTIITCYLVIAYDARTIVRKLLLICLVALLLSVIAAMFFPDAAFSPEDGRFRGVFTHKSVLGQCLIITAFLLILAYQDRIVPLSMILAGCGLVAGLVIPAKSVTAVVLISALLFLAILPKMWSERGPQSWVFVFAGCALAGMAVLVAVVFFDDLMAFVGRDATVTGRTEIWSYIFAYIERRPFLGYGYGAFFGDEAYVWRLRQVFLFDLTGGHSGYLQVWLDIGIVGLGIVVGILMLGLIRSMRVLVAGNDLAARFGVFWLVMYFGRNMVESDLLSQSHVSWPLALLSVLFHSPGLVSSCRSPRNAKVGMIAAGAAPHGGGAGKGAVGAGRRSQRAAPARGMGRFGSSG